MKRSLVDLLNVSDVLLKPRKSVILVGDLFVDHILDKDILVQIVMNLLQ